MTEIKTRDGVIIKRVSRWIMVHDEIVTMRHRLASYAHDSEGRVEGQTGFDPSKGLHLMWFRWNGRKWAFDQFLRLSYPIMWDDEDGKLNYLSAYDGENWYNPILIELSECCDYVRVYEEVRGQ